MVNDIPLNEFLRIRKELDALPANSKQRSDLAIGYLMDYNLPEQVSYEALRRYFLRSNPPQAVWKWVYLLERSVPYYTATSPEWQRRLLLFVSTWIIEKHLEGYNFVFRDHSVALNFSRYSGDHENLHAGPNAEDAPDYYIYFNDTKDYFYVDVKFAPKARFTDIGEAGEYYSGGKHMHGAKLLIIFLEADERFYLIDYETNEYFRMPISAPVEYVHSELLNSYPDPLDPLADLSEAEDDEIDKLI